MCVKSTFFENLSKWKCRRVQKKTLKTLDSSLVFALFSIFTAPLWLYWYYTTLLAYFYLGCFSKLLLYVNMFDTNTFGFVCINTYITFPVVLNASYFLWLSILPCHDCITPAALLKELLRIPTMYISPHHSISFYLLY